MKISLVIPAYNEEHYIGECLDSVLKSAQGRFFEIIVVNNASTDGTRAEALKRPGVRVVDEPKKGLTSARQRGLEEAKGDLIAYIDADTRIPPGWVDKALEIFAEDLAIVCVSGPYKYYDGSRIRNTVIQALWWCSAPLTFRVVGYMVLGGNFIAKKQAIEKAGGFDTSIDFYGEDTDIARRLHTQGRVVFRMGFFIYASSRRFVSEGMFKLSFVYAVNFLSQVLYGKPVTKKYKDIRLASTEKQ